eukprot:Rmarinus@m.7104
MSEEKKDKKNKNDKKKKGSGFDFEFKFNFYWVYVIIAIAFVAMVLAPEVGQDIRTLDNREFEELVESHDVGKVVIVNEKIAEIYIDTEALKTKEKYEKIKNNLFGNTLNPGPHYFYEIGDLQNFESWLKKLQADFPEEDLIATKNETRRNWGDAVGWLLPIVLLVAVWVFLMRRMSGGAGGGAQIFNIGKSRAQVFEGDMKVNVTFDDVA